MYDQCPDCGEPLKSHWNFCPICSCTLIYNEEDLDELATGPLDFAFIIIEEGEEDVRLDG